MWNLLKCRFNMFPLNVTDEEEKVIIDAFKYALHRMIQYKHLHRLERIGHFTTDIKRNINTSYPDNYNFNKSLRCIYQSRYYDDAGIVNKYMPYEKEIKEIIYMCNQEVNEEKDLIELDNAFRQLNIKNMELEKINKESNKLIEELYLLTQ